VQPQMEAKVKIVIVAGLDLANDKGLREQAFT
jgi:hypothetical protein